MARPRPLLRTLPALILAVAAVWAAWGFAAGWERASADTYEVQPGDTLHGIAGLLQVDVSVILALNTDIVSPNQIYIGQQLRIPDNTPSLANGHAVTAATAGTVAAATAPSAVQSGGSALSYDIQPGDTLSAIAAQFGTTISALLALNPVIEANPDRIPIGYTLLIRAPGPSDDPTQGSSASGRDRDGGSPALTAGAQARELGSTSTQTIEYTVQPSEYASNIAEAHGITLELLQQRNPSVNLEVIHPGQVLLIPVPDYRVAAIDPSDTSAGLTDIYIVRPGEYAGEIASRFEITLAELSRLNDRLDLSTIYIGQRLVVPWLGSASDAPTGTVPAVAERRRMHRVQPGDTFASVAALYGLGMDDLRALNPLRPSDLLVIGERLILPGVIDPPVVSETRTLWEADLVQYAAASLGVTPRTLIANYPSLQDGDWMSAGSSWHLPLREGRLVTVQAGDTLQSIANAHGANIWDILSDPANGVDDSNALVIGQEIIIPFDGPSFAWPASGEITDPFGLCRSWDCSYRHRGLDLALDLWEPIVASADGVVSFVGGDPGSGLGWYVEVDHGDGWTTIYAHLIEFAVWQGQIVSQGDVLGYNGSTGYSTGPHLHFEVQHDGWYIDPLVVLPR